MGPQSAAGEQSRKRGESLRESEGPNRPRALLLRGAARGDAARWPGGAGWRGWRPGLFWKVPADAPTSPPPHPAVSLSPGETKARRHNAATSLSSGSLSKATPPCCPGPQTPPPVASCSGCHPPQDLLIGAFPQIPPLGPTFTRPAPPQQAPSPRHPSPAPSPPPSRPRSWKRHILSLFT